MTLSEQTITDVRTMLDTTEQRLHEMTGTPDAVNSHDPAEVASMYDLRDHLRGLLGD